MHGRCTKCKRPAMVIIPVLLRKRGGLFPYCFDQPGKLCGGCRAKNLGFWKYDRTAVRAHEPEGDR